MRRRRVFVFVLAGRLRERGPVRADLRPVGHDDTEREPLLVLVNASASCVCIVESTEKFCLLTRANIKKCRRWYTKHVSEAVNAEPCWRKMCSRYSCDGQIILAPYR